MTERARFVALYDEGLYTMTELCERFMISRKTGYKWVARFQAEGVAGLAEQSRAPRRCPHRTSEAVEAALVDARKRRPHWGPKKLIPTLRRERPELDLPAPSTAAAVLKRHGLITEGRRRRRQSPHPGSGPLKAEAPNDLWCADFKGEFRTRNGVLCYPLTITDAHSRFVLACYALPTTGFEGAHPVFSRVFAEHGLPLAIRTDNGSPFATKALAGLSRLSTWWTKLEIGHQRITPGHPEENPHHERMHRTLKAETTRPPEWDLFEQQQRFEAFRKEFNQERPHEALGQEPPAEHYTVSPRSLPGELPEPEYEGHLEVRLVSPNGNIKFRQQEVFVSGVLTGERVALEEVDEGIWSVYFYQRLIGRLNEREARIV